MGLQRTPPKRARDEANTADPEPQGQEGRGGGGGGGSRQSTSTVGETSFPSTARAFEPRNPRVMRSPLSGSTNTSNSTSNRALPPSGVAVETQTTIPSYPYQYQDETTTGAIDPDVSTTPRMAPPTQPQEQQQEQEQRQEQVLDVDTTMGDTTAIASNLNRRQDQREPSPQVHDPITPLPANKRRKSRHPAPAPIAQSQHQSQSQGQSRSPQPDHEDTVVDPEQELSQYEKNALYGKRYQVMMETLELAIKASSEKWTLPQFTECFPRFSAQNKDLFTNLWDEYRTKMKEDLWRESTALIEASNFGPALRKIEDAVQEAKENGTEQGRSNAWRPDMSVKTVAAAANLPIHDATYAKLRQEYLQLHKDCTDRYSAIADKQAQLHQFESTVSDGVIDLEKTIKLLDGFPSEEMVKWMELGLASVPLSGSK